MALLSMTSAVSRLFLASAAPSTSVLLVRAAAARPFSCLVRPQPQLTSLTVAPSAAVAMQQPCRGIQHKGRPGRRCGSCWIEIIDERMHVFCNKGRIEHRSDLPLLLCLKSIENS